MFALYKSALAIHPVATKAITAGTLMSVSDIICQSVERQVVLPDWNENDGVVRLISLGDHKWADHSQHDWKRTIQVGVTGLTFSGPFSHFWYQALDKFVRIQARWLNVGTKMVLDAILFSPMAVAGYFVWRSMLEGVGVEGTHKKLQTKWRSALVASWSFWPAANAINFAFVPLPFRVVYNNSLSLGWNFYLSRLNSNDKMMSRLEED